MRSRSLATQVTIAAISVAAVVAVAFVVSIAAILSLHASTSRETHSKDVVAATLRAQTLVVDLESGIRGFVITQKPRFLEPYQNAQRSWPSRIARLKQLVARDHDEERRAHFVANLVSAYETDYASNVINIVRIFGSSAVDPTATSEAKIRIDRIRDQLSRILAVEAHRSQTRAATARAVEHQAIVAGSVGLGASALLVLLFGGWIARAVARPVRHVSESAAAVAAGDLSTRLDEGGTGEIGALTQAFNAMTRSLELSRRELLAQNDRLRASEEAKSDLISMISHEVRTPLASIIGFTALLLERDFVPEERRRYLEIVDTEARRLAELAEDFLDVRLLEEGRLELSIAPIDVAELVRGQTGLFFAHTQQHVVTVDVPPGEIVIPGDHDRLAQVVSNLLSNAIKYSPNGGRVTVSLIGDASCVRLSVSDDGIGIAPRDQSRIFEKFFRGGAVAAGIPGTGLGLAVARTIVDGHGGRMGFESREGVGSTFWMELPLNPDAETDRHGDQPLEEEAVPLHPQV